MANRIEISFDNAKDATTVLTKLFADEGLAKLGVRVRADIGNEVLEEPEVVRNIPRLPPIFREVEKLKRATAKKTTAPLGRPRKRASARPVDREDLAKALRDPGFSAKAYARRHKLIPTTVNRAAKAIRDREGMPKPKRGGSTVKADIDMVALRKAMKEPGFSGGKYAKKIGYSQTTVAKRVRDILAEDDKQDRQSRARQMLSPDA